MANRQSALILRHLRKMVPDPQAERQSDRQLLQQFLATQDETAFAALVRRHGSMVLAVCQSILHHEQDAQDASQATFLVLARKASSIRKQESVGSWLHGVAYRLALKARKDAAKRRRRETKLPPLSGEGQGEVPMDDLTWRELREVLHQELSRLPEKNRLPLILCYLEGQTQEEAARQLGWTAATVKGRLDRGRSLLRTRLTRRGLTLSVPLLAAALSRDIAIASSPAWLKATVQGAMLFARGESAATLSSQAAAWAQGALNAMAVGKLKTGATLILAFGFLAAGTGLVFYQAPTANESRETQEKPTAEAKALENHRQEAPAPARLDQFGDPLPAEAVARLGTVRFRHASWVNSIAFMPDGEHILSHGYEDGIRVWDAATGRELRNVLAKRGDWIGGAMLSPDGKFVLSLERHENQKDSVIHIRNWSELKPVREFAVGYLQNPQLSPDGKILAGLGSQYGPIELWDVATGRQLRSWKSNGEYIWCLTFSLDGKTLATGGADKIIRFWEVASGKLRRGIGTPNIVKKIALSGDGALAASLGMTKIESGAVSVFPPENQIRVWDVLTGKELRQLAMSAQKRPLREPEGFCNLSFAPDGKTLVTTGADGAVRFWDPAKGKELRHYNLGTKGELKMAFAADGKKLALAGGTIQVIDVASGKETVQLPGHSLGISAAALTPDGRIAITASYEQPILLWDPATGREVGRIEAPQGAIESFRILDSGRTLLTCSSDNMIGFWDLAERKEGRQFALPAGAPNWVPHMLAVSSDGKTLALAGTGNILALLDLETGKELRQLKGDVWISGAAFAPDGRTIAVWYGDHTVQVWDVTTGQMVRRFPFAEEFNAARGAPPRVIAPGDKSSFSYIAGASPDGRLIAYGSQFRYLVLHELASGKKARSLDHLPDGVSAVAFSPDSKMLAWGGWNDPAVHLVEVATGQERHHLGGHKGRITSLSFSVDGQSLISGGQDTATVVWDITGKLAAKKKWGGLLSAQDLDACWTDLACDAAARAFQAIRRLAASPTEAIPYLREHLKPVPAVDEKRLVRLIVDLDSNQFDVRESATKEMEKLGELAAPACRKALEQKPFAEARRRLEALIEKQNREWQDPSTEQLRALRALEVLEHIGNQEASQIVASLANGAPEARLTQQAKASKERLAKRLSVAP